MLAKLLVAYGDLRRNADYLTKLIHGQLRKLTIHDITHLDALWVTVDLIAGPKFSTNQLGMFVLSSAILMHDAGHDVESIEGGFDALKKTAEWRDAAVAQLATRGVAPITQALIDLPPADLVDDILFVALR